MTLYGVCRLLLHGSSLATLGSQVTERYIPHLSTDHRKEARNEQIIEAMKQLFGRTTRYIGIAIWIQFEVLPWDHEYLQTESLLDEHMMNDEHNQPSICYTFIMSSSLFMFFYLFSCSSLLPFLETHNLEVRWHGEAFSICVHIQLVVQEQYIHLQQQPFPSFPLHMTSNKPNLDQIVFYLAIRYTDSPEYGEGKQALNGIRGVLIRRWLSGRRW